MKKEFQRKLSFVLFVMAVFFAGMALTVFCEHIWMAAVAGVLLLGASVFFAFCPKEESQSATEKTTELLLADRMAELVRGNEKAEKGVYIAVKKQHEAMESGMAALQQQITELIKAQETAVKTLVMYNKENAKQVALSQREELGRLREELQHSQTGSGNSGSSDAVVDAIREMSHRLYEEIHENGEAVLAELGTTVDSLEEIREMIGDLEAGIPVTVDRGPTETFEQAEESLENAVYDSEDELPIEEPEEEELSEEEEQPVDMFAGAGVDLSDPNKPLSADDIAALFAQANAMAEVAETEGESEVALPAEEPVAEEKPEDAFASSGVDLSDPNKPLSADDIAALFAAMGN